MKFEVRKKILALSIVLLIPLSGFTGNDERFNSDSPSNKYRNHIGEELVTDWHQEYEVDQSTVSTGEWNFIRRLVKRIDKAPYSVVLFAGYSAAGYLNETGVDVERDIKESLIAAQRRANRGGVNGKVVSIFGGTTDGIGVGYRIADDLKRAGKINLISAGIVSEQAVAYPDSIAKQDEIYLVNSFKNEKGEQSWEVKESLYGSSMNVSVPFSLAENANDVSMEVFEGGEIALREALAFVLEAKTNFKYRRVGLDLTQPTPNLSLVLNIGYDALKPAKDKGPRAATQMLYLLANYPWLIPSNVQVYVQDYSFSESPYVRNGRAPLARYLESNRAKWKLGQFENIDILLGAAENTEKLLAPRPASPLKPAEEPTPAYLKAQAMVRKYQAFKNTKALAQDVLNQEYAVAYEIARFYDGHVNHPMAQDRLDRKQLAAMDTKLSALQARRDELKEWSTKFSSCDSSLRKK